MQAVWKAVAGGSAVSWFLQTYFLFIIRLLFGQIVLFDAEVRKQDGMMLQ